MRFISGQVKIYLNKSIWGIIQQCNLIHVIWTNPQLWVEAKVMLALVNSTSKRKEIIITLHIKLYSYAAGEYGVAMRRKNEVIHSPLSLLFVALLPTSSFSLFSFIFPHPFFFAELALLVVWHREQWEGWNFFYPSWHILFQSFHMDLLWAWSSEWSFQHFLPIFSQGAAHMTALGSVLSDLWSVPEGSRGSV